MDVKIIRDWFSKPANLQGLPPGLETNVEERHPSSGVAAENTTASTGAGGSVDEVTRRPEARCHSRQRDTYEL
jgi:hypothetical protein